MSGTIPEMAILGGFGQSIRALVQDWPPRVHKVARLTKDTHNEYEVAKQRESETAPSKDVVRE